MPKILIVDDVPDNLKLLTYELEDAGYEVLNASNGKEALRVVHDQGPHIVITDLMMPVMDGMELCRAIRHSEVAGFVYIIMLTAHSDRAQLVEAFEAGADDFLSKPFAQTELTARLKAASRIVALEAALARERLALHKSNAELAVVNERLENLSKTDDLTGLGNRREAMRYLEECWSAARRKHRALSCLLVDIDHFKRCNDDHGHDVGDAVLRAVAAALRAAAPAGEPVFRIGGEEFLIVCPGSDLPAAQRGAERYRCAVRSTSIACPEATVRVTVSVGVAQNHDDLLSAEQLLNQADKALYAAKRAGRDQVCTLQPTPADASSQVTSAP